MSADRIQYKDIFDPKALDLAIAEVGRLKKELDSTADVLKEMVSTSSQLAKAQSGSFDNADKIRATEKAITDTVKAAEDLAEVDRNRALLEVKLSKLIGNRAKLLEDLEVKVVDLKKAQKKLREEEKAGLKTAEEAARERSNLQNKIKLTQKAINEERKALIASTEARAESTKQVSKSAKMEAELIRLKTEEAAQEAILAERLTKARKALKDNAKEAIANRDAFQELTKQTNDAQKKFKILAAEFGATSKQAKEAHKDFIRLDDQLREVNDAAKDGRRDVGRYEKAVEDLGNTMENVGKAAAGLGLLSKIFDGFTAVLGNNSEAGAGVEKVLGAITVTFTVLLGRLTKAVPFLAKLFVSAFDDVSSFFKGLILEVKIFATEVKDTLSFSDSSSKINDLKKELAGLQKETSSTGGAFDELAKVFEGTGDEIANTIEKNNSLIDTTLAYRKEIIELNKQIDAKLSKQADLQATADNENKSLVDRIEAQKELILKTKEIHALELEISKRNETLAKKNAGVFGASVEAEEAAQAATSERIALEIEQKQELADQDKELQTQKRDLLEQDLDFLIDDFDNQKTINERIIADETTTFEEKKRLSELNRTLADQNYKAQIDLFNLRAAEQGKAQLDLEALVNESDSRVIKEKARVAGISEAILVRVLEMIRERRTVEQDLIETKAELNKENLESLEIEEETARILETINDLKKDGVDVEGVLGKLEEENLKQSIKDLKFKIALLKEGAPARKKLENDLAKALLEQKTINLEKEEEAAQKAIDRNIEMQEAAATTLESLAQKRHEKKLSRIDEQLDAERKREDELRAMAQQGNQDAENNLAENQKRQAELEKQREKELKRQKVFELGLATARAYSANVAAGSPNPLAKTVSDIAVLQAFIESLTGHYHGTEDTGTSGVVSDEHGVITGYTHAKERVMTAAQNAALPSNTSNWELVRMATMSNNPTSAGGSEAILANGLQEVKNAIERKPVFSGREYSATERAIVDTYVERGKITRKHYKRGGLISKRK